MNIFLKKNKILVKYIGIILLLQPSSRVHTSAHFAYNTSSAFAVYSTLLPFITKGRQLHRGAPTLSNNHRDSTNTNPIDIAYSATQ